MSTQPVPASVTTQMASLARPLRSAARALEIIAFISAVGGIVGGIGLATVKTTTLGSDFLGNATTQQSHPYVALGIGFAIEVLVASLLFWAVARGLQLFAVDVAARHGVDLDATTVAAAQLAVSPTIQAMTGREAGWYPRHLGGRSSAPAVLEWNPVDRSDHPGRAARRNRGATPGHSRGTATNAAVSQRPELHGTACTEFTRRLVSRS